MAACAARVSPCYLWPGQSATLSARCLLGVRTMQPHQRTRARVRLPHPCQAAMLARRRLLPPCLPLPHPTRSREPTSRLDPRRARMSATSMLRRPARPHIARLRCTRASPRTLPSTRRLRHLRILRLLRASQAIQTRPAGTLAATAAAATAAAAIPALLGPPRRHPMVRACLAGRPIRHLLSPPSRSKVGLSRLLTGPQLATRRWAMRLAPHTWRPVRPAAAARARQRSTRIRSPRRRRCPLERLRMPN